MQNTCVFPVLDEENRENELKKIYMSTKEGQGKHVLSAEIDDLVSGVMELCLAKRENAMKMIEIG